MEPLLLYFRESSLELWSVDSNGRLKPVLFQSSNKIPLNFLVSGEQILMDSYAKEAYYKNEVGAFGDFWTNTGAKKKEYQRFGIQHSFDTLLPYALKESIFPAVLRSTYPSLNFADFLQSNLLFVLYDSFIDVELREVINNGFFETIGFSPGSISIVDFWEIFNTNVRVNSESIVAVNASLGNIYLHVVGRTHPYHLSKKIIEGKGRDPRLDTVLDFIAEAAVTEGSQMSVTLLKKELTNDGEIILSMLGNNRIRHSISNRNIDVNPLELNFHKSVIEGRLNNNQVLNLVRNEFDLFRRANSAESIPIYLLGEIINQQSFKEFFRSTYSGVVVQQANFEEALILNAFKNKSFVDSGNRSTGFSQAPSGSIPPLAPAPTGAKPPVLAPMPTPPVRQVPPSAPQVKAPPAPAPVPKAAPLPPPVVKAPPAPTPPPKAAPLPPPPVKKPVAAPPAPSAPPKPAPMPPPVAKPAAAPPPLPVKKAGPPPPPPKKTPPPPPPPPRIK